ncbi:P-loop containing nucleoside triphosphate hydrolase protein [Melampsora americana]|nr:P-loop containing nucleoside triphosphate hydrolase protein [Melampsora americana]
MSKEPTSTSFQDLNVHSSLISALKSLSIHSPTEIQAKTIPDILNGRDCIGSSQTGSGKTIAFSIPILQGLAKDPSSCYALILTPTRELAFQISSQLKVLGSLAIPGFSSTVIVGGIEMTSQAIELRKRPHVIIATPGRLVDHLKSSDGEIGNWDLKRCKFLVLDEADRMLTSTFADPLAYLINHHLPPPSQRQTLLFTATLTEPVLALANKDPPPGKLKPVVHLCGPRGINLPENLRQLYSFVPSQVKETYLYYLLLNINQLTGLVNPFPKSKKPSNSRSSKRTKYSNRIKRLITEEEEMKDPVIEIPQTIIFVSKPRTAEMLKIAFDSDFLPFKIPACSLHSNLTQIQRLKAIEDFEERRFTILISTDLGSRGLDLKQVKLVINWDIPLDFNEYVHRIGRTARGIQSDGVSISLVAENDVDCVLGIEEKMGMKMEELVMKEDKVLEYLNPVSKAKREAYLELEENKFGEKQKINKLKRMKLDKKRKEIES